MHTGVQGDRRRNQPVVGRSLIVLVGIILGGCKSGFARPGIVVVVGVDYCPQSEIAISRKRAVVWDCDGWSGSHLVGCRLSTISVGSVSLNFVGISVQFVDDVGICCRGQVFGNHSVVGQTLHAVAQRSLVNPTAVLSVSWCCPVHFKCGFVDFRHDSPSWSLRCVVSDICCLYGGFTITFVVYGEHFVFVSSACWNICVGPCGLCSWSGAVNRFHQCIVAKDVDAGYCCVVFLIVGE